MAPDSDWLTSDEDGAGGSGSQDPLNKAMLRLSKLGCDMKKEKKIRKDRICCCQNSSLWHIAAIIAAESQIGICNFGKEFVGRLGLDLWSFHILARGWLEDRNRVFSCPSPPLGLGLPQKRHSRRSACAAWASKIAIAGVVVGIGGHFGAIPWVFKFRDVSRLGSWRPLQAATAVGARNLGADAAARCRCNVRLGCWVLMPL